MTGYITVGLMLGLGGYWALLLSCRSREHGIVYAAVPRWLSYFHALGEAARAAAAATQRYRDALDGVSRAYGVFQLNWRRP